MKEKAHASHLMESHPCENLKGFDALLIRHELFMKLRRRLLGRRNSGARVRGFAQAWSCDLSQQL